MDNLAPPYLHGPLDAEAQHRLDKLLLVGDPQLFLTSEVLGNSPVLMVLGRSSP
ncbi:MAG: hypothetical protein ACRD8U_16065 [Pyrinomonadaceae bacterium]